MISGPKSQSRLTGAADVVAARFCTFASLRAASSRQLNRGATGWANAPSRWFEIVRSRLAGAPVRDNIIGDLLAFVEVRIPARSTALM
jgi:hypothetical protein